MFFVPTLLITVRFSLFALSIFFLRMILERSHGRDRKEEKKAKAVGRKLGAHRREIHLPNRD